MRHGLCATSRLPTSSAQNCKYGVSGAVLKKEGSAAVLMSYKDMDKLRSGYADIPTDKTDGFVGLVVLGGLVGAMSIHRRGAASADASGGAARSYGLVFMLVTFAVCLRQNPNRHCG